VSGKKENSVWLGTSRLEKWHCNVVFEFSSELLCILDGALEENMLKIAITIQ
jgi:hypothetical protein